eukprot:CAMPEP_0171466886 /NCGR_PEP_ID=MMETSP0945-20130129/9587_1 /TAXON_ID=109269 /ORGANISM="Vaucheria litorea, Strain CCMP2940" /LENGTH=53 /DNA_ID=CAMNT_0011995187 /DNA_START=152 /DNA_END=309 /DNA_ORIENTATION=-
MTAPNKSQWRKTALDHKPTNPQNDRTSKAKPYAIEPIVEKNSCIMAKVGSSLA